MKIIGAKQQVTPFEEIILDVMAKMQRGVSPDVAAARAATMCQVIISRIEKEGMFVGMKGDLVKIDGPQLGFTEPQMKQVGFDSKDAFIRQTVVEFGTFAGQVIAENGLCQIAQTFGSIDDQPATGLQISTTLFVPGWAKQVQDKQQATQAVIEHAAKAVTHPDGGRA
jgi:hypothetical protein